MNQNGASGQRVLHTGLVLLGAVLLALPATLVPGITEGTGVVWLIAAATAPKSPSRSMLLPFAGAALALVSAAWSADAGQTVLTGMLWLAGAGLLTAIRREQLAALHAGLCVAVLAMAVQALRQWSFGLEAAREAAELGPAASQSFAALWAERRRVMGPFPSPDVLGGFLVCVLPLCLEPVVRGGNRVRRILGLTASVCGAVTLVGTQSVGAAIAAVVGMGAAAGVAWWKEHPGRVMAGAAAGVGALVVLVWWRTLDPSTHALMSASHRLEDWGNALQVWTHVSPLGVGAGAYESAFNAWSPQGRRYSAYVHNGPLQVLVELGIPGFLLVVTCYLLAVRGSLLRARAGGWGALAAAGVLAGVVHHQLDYDLHVQGSMGLWLAAAALWADRDDDVKPMPAAGGFKVLLGMAAVAAAWLGAGVALTERGIPRLPDDQPDIVSSGRGLNLIPFDARAHLSVAEDLWLFALASARRGEDPRVVWERAEALCVRASRNAPLLPAGPMMLARGLASRQLYPQALEAYSEAVKRACCSRNLHTERRAVAERLNVREVVEEETRWLEEHP